MVLPVPGFLSSRVPIAAMLLVIAGLPHGAAAERLDVVQSTMVWCHDTSRNLVSQRPKHRCSGEIVSEERAREIKKSRRNFMMKRFNKPPPVVPGRKLGGTGTGFFISADGYVLTNAHVIDDCKAISVRPAASGGKDVVSKLVGADYAQDLALIKAPIKPPAYARLRAGRVLADEEVTVVGYPLHGRVTIKPIKVEGRVYRSFDTNVRPQRFMMKIDIRRGNSGGPIMDRRGLIVGVVVAKINTPGMYQQTGKVVRNVGIGIRLNTVIKFLHDQPVEISWVAPREQPEPENLFSLARQWVVQIGCYK